MDVNFSKSGLLVYSSMHFIGIIPDKPSPRKFYVYASESKRCCDAVVIPLPNNNPLVHASPVIESGIHLSDAAVAVTGSLLALATPLVTPNVDGKPKKTVICLISQQVYEFHARPTDAAPDALAISETRGRRGVMDAELAITGFRISRNINADRRKVVVLPFRSMTPSQKFLTPFLI